MLERPEKPTSIQLLFMWNLVAKGGEAWKQDVKPELTAPSRRELVASGWLLERWGMRSGGGKQVRALQVELSEKGWKLLEERMSDPLTSRSPAGTEILGEVLGAVAHLMKRRDITLAEVFDRREEAKAPSQPGSVAPLPLDASAILARIRESVLRIAEPGGGVTLAALRSDLADIDRTALDSTLSRLVKDGSVVLYPFDDPERVDEATRKAALRLSGIDFNILYLK